MASRSGFSSRMHAVLAASLLVASTGEAQVKPDIIDAVLASGRLSFVGHATVGDFVGATTTMTGVVSGELASARGWVESPVATLATGNDRRDRDMRASLEASRFPTMRFDLGRTSLATGSELILHGTLTIHGVSRVVDLRSTLVRSADSLHVTAEFPLNLADYRIGGLTKLFGILRMDPHIEVRLDLRFVGTAPRP
jgi:polyisoprenoid-binding protein YceI